MPFTVVKNEPGGTGGARGVRLHVGVRPGDVRLRHVAVPAGADGGEVGALIGDEDQPIGEARRGRDVAAEAIDAPEFGAGGRLIGDDPRVAAGDDRFDVAPIFTKMGVLQEFGTGRLACQTVLPVFGFNASSADLPSSARRALVELHDQVIGHEQQRGRVAVDVIRHAQVARPARFAADIETGDVAIGKAGVNALAVGRHRRRGVAGIAVTCGDRPSAGIHLARPEQFAAIGVEAVDRAVGGIRAR